MTAQRKTPEALQGNGGNEIEPTLTKETIHLNQNTSVIPATATTTLSPEAEGFILANRDAQILPVDAIIASFARPERSHVADRLKPVIAANEIARLSARTHIVPSYHATEWADEDFYLIAETGQHCRPALASPTDPERRQLHGQSTKPSNHPVLARKAGDKWSFTNEEDETYTYEHLGLYRLVGKFEDADTEITQYVVREVTQLAPSDAWDRCAGSSATN